MANMVEMSAHAISHNTDTGFVGAARTERRLSELRGYFADEEAYSARLAQADCLVYSVSSVEPAQGEGQLHFGMGMLMPGKVGAEYFLTKGHAHSWRAAAEVYIGLQGEGALLLEDVRTGAVSLVSLRPHDVVYVPGFTAHRTINIGTEPLTYLGVYPAEAGHDYAVVAERNFSHVVIEIDGSPALVERKTFLAGLVSDHKE
jgi:glucose-6-phosphate isomerase